MNHNIDINNIKCAKYGQLSKIIDVTKLLIDKLKNEGKFIISENFSINKMLVLYIYFNDNTKITLMHGMTVSISQLITNPIPTEPDIKITNNNNSNYILSTNVRDESNILEWIIYHLLIGFDKIVIIDHNSKIPVLNLIQNYEWKHRIHVIRRTDEGPVKMKFLNDIIIPYMYVNCKRYFIHLDADEYIYIKYPNIETLLNKYNAPILTLHWVMFGNNNVLKNTHPDNFLIPTFTKSGSSPVDHFKCFIKIIKNTPFIFTNPHTIKFIKEPYTLYTNILNNKVKYTNNMDKLFSELSINNISLNEDIPAYINHYYVQSKEDYVNRKLNRTRDDNNQKRLMEENIFDNYNDITNYNLEKYTNNILYLLNDIKNFGFIILRYVNSEDTNKSWIRCYESIRKFYNNKIVIIDDNSDKKYLTSIKLYNTVIINSEFPKRGELLPYYYYIKNKFFTRAVVLHDSMEIIKYYDFMNITNYHNYTRLFSFPNNSYQIDIEYFNEMSTYIKHGQTLYKYHITNKNNLIGCFGVCYVIDYDFLQNIENKYNITNLVNFIDSRRKRMNLERFLSCLFEFHRAKTFITPIDIFGNIHKNNNLFIKKYFYGR